MESGPLWIMGLQAIFFLRNLYFSLLSKFSTKIAHSFENQTEIRTEAESLDPDRTCHQMNGQPSSWKAGRARHTPAGGGLWHRSHLTWARRQGSGAEQGRAAGLAPVP